MTTRQTKPRRPRANAGDPSAQSAHKKAVLEAYAETCTISHACQVANIGRRTFYDWQKNDPEFAAAVADVEALVGDKLLKEAIRRAVDGVSEPVGWYQGNAGGHVQKYSDGLLIRLLQAFKPEKFADRHEFSGVNGGPIEIVPVPKFDTPQAFAAWVASQQSQAHEE